MTQRPMKHAFKSFSLLFVLSAIIVSCSKDKGGGGQPVATPAPTVVVPSLSSPVMTAEEHDPRECPRGLMGAWNTMDSSGVWHYETFRREGPSIVMQKNGSQMIFDGSVRELERTPEMQMKGSHFWYVGGCRNGKVVVKIAVQDPTTTFHRREVISVRHNRIEVRTRSTVGGFTDLAIYVGFRAR